MYDNIKILTFAKGNFINSQKLLHSHLNNLGLKNQKHLNDNDLPKKFLNEYKEILSYKRGYGYCIWKPFIILEELKLMNNEDILLYIDSTDLPEKSFFEYVIENFKKNDYFFVNQGYNHGQWTKRDTFVLMNCDYEEYYNHVQLEAGVIGFKKTNFNLNLIQDWFNYCTNINILTEIPNICNLPNVNNFIEHRYDQSILTNLFIKNKLDSHYLKSDKIKYNYNQPKIY